MAMLPAYQIDPNPFGQSMRYAGESMRNALMAYGQMREKDNLRMGQIEALARTPGVGLAQAESLAADPALARNVLMQYSDPMLGLRKEDIRHGMSHRDAVLAENRRMHDQTIRQQDRMFDMQAGQIRNQSPEGKAQIAINAGIARGTPEFNQFVYGITPQQPKTMEVNGRVIALPPGGGPATVLYDGGQNFDKLPEFSAKAAGFTSRMVEAENNTRRITADANRFDPTSVGTGMIRSMLPEAIGNVVARSPEMQQYEQSAEQWIRAFLRKESGAAIGRDEFARDFKVYFPQPGDGPDVVKQKERARLDAMRSFQGETRGFFDYTSPQQAARLKGWQQPQANPALDEARAAIQRGAPRDKVIERLRQNGIDPSGL